MNMKSQYIATVIVILITFEIKGEAKSTCGRRLVNHKALVTDGFQTKEGDWPWHAAIYHIVINDLKYRCGGTVLHVNIILTAAHCVFEKNRRIPAERVYVSLGKHDLILHGTNTQDFRAHRIIPHPDYDISSLFNDIALIRLKTEAKFDNYVQPICLWNKNKVEISEVIGKRGIVIGWGITEMEELSDTLRQAFMPVVSSITCLQSNRDFFGNFLSDNNFCAGFRNGTSVCNGDSGGSIAFEENGIYHIRGIVSLTVARIRETGDPALCDSKEYVIFTDVAKYLTWIEEVLNMLDPLIKEKLYTPDPLIEEVLHIPDPLIEEVAHIPDPPKSENQDELIQLSEKSQQSKPVRSLSLPVPSKCSSRPKEFMYKGKNMFLSSHIPALAGKKVDWLDGRNLCREYCMDLVALETQEKNSLIFRLIQTNDVPYIWTAGRLCDFKGCEKRTDLEPKNLNGWFWAATREKIKPTNRIPSGWGYNPWSQTGHKKVPQPDNAEFDINETSESCLSVLNNVYNDGIAWHDVACYHERPFVCEDSEELLNYVTATNPGIRL